ncbi:hypothetical protein [Methylocella silvestris]|uniref:hypothetical protein n=1 Tax=Methylocella silvestris TaxID=199596 RepID=UPI0011D0E89C|nr:hypothetical protein [Methylocella silvestris]
MNALINQRPSKKPDGRDLENQHLQSISPTPQGGGQDDAASQNPSARRRKAADKMMRRRSQGYPKERPARREKNSRQFASL